MSGVETSDESLMARLAAGEQDALESLMERYQQDIFRFCLHYLKDAERAKDMAQETFIRVFTACGRFDPSRKFRPWILCIARNLCLNELKRKKTVPMDSLEEYTASARVDPGRLMTTAEDSPAEFAMSGERRDLLDEALHTLKNEAREIIALRFFQRMSAREIAEIVGSTEGAVRTKLHRALNSLRKAYQDRKSDL